MVGTRKAETWNDHEVQDWSSYMAAKKAKLENQYQSLVNKEFQSATNLFKGVAIFVNGWTNPCADELRRLMMTHGGIYHHYQRAGATTHLIASNLPYSKIVQYRKSKNPIPLCKPEWIIDSIKANKLLDWRLYLLYTSTSITQPQLQFESKIVPTLSTNLNHAMTSDSGPSSNTPMNSGMIINTPTASKQCEATSKSLKLIKEFKPNNGALCSKNDKFLSEYYNNSRLHHIATMGATFKEYVKELRLKSNQSFHGLEYLKQLGKNSARAPTIGMHDYNSDDDLFNSPDICDEKKNESIIMHIDMDCFFVSVGLKTKPQLKGVPVAVTHARGNKPSMNANENEEQFKSMAEIASCSYEARQAGLKNGMLLGQALKLCPNLKTIKYDFEGYKEVSYILYNTVASYTLDIEAVSCDEMYADISTILQQTNLTALEFATIIRHEIKEKTGCPVSTGFGSNKLQARLATKRAKPDGQFHLEGEDVQSYVGSINVKDLPGVGYATMHQLKKMNVHICFDLQKISLVILQKEFGKKTGEMLYNTCRGIDLSKLNIEHVRQSVSTEVNYGIRFENDDDATKFLKQLSKEVVDRLTKVNAKGRCITLKLMVRAKDAPLEPPKFMGHGLCDNFTKSKNLLTSIDDETIITKEVLSLWEQMQQPAHDIRGIGIHISRLETLKKYSNTYLMKFIAKAKSSVSSEQVSTNKIKSPLNSITNSESSQKNKNIYEAGKKEELKVSRPQGLKAFFTSAKSSAPPQKSTEKLNQFSNNINIEEAVLAESPEDIKLEIGNVRKQNLNVNANVQDNVGMDKQDTKQKDCDDQTILLSQDIDEKVLNELPLDIRNEILASRVSANKIKRVTSKKHSQTPHSQPENYFKHVKPGKSNKSKLPDIGQLDMKVLIELPDDIRNEILNHYKTNKNYTIETKDANHPQMKRHHNIANDQNTHLQISKNNDDLLNVSFSQIDPEFLSALPEDMKDDVKMYCMAKKKERLSKLKNQESVEPADVRLKARNTVNIKKRGRKTKNAQSNVPSLLKTIFKTKMNENNNAATTNNGSNQVIHRNQSFLEDKMNIKKNDNVVINDRWNNIKLHRRSFEGNTENSDEHRAIITNIVDHLFRLSMRQVKNQIEMWISKSESVNEIDVISLTTFLSMLPKERRIEDLHILMRTMHRCMTEIGSCVWHETYSRIVEHVQYYMQIEYSSNLMLPSIRCNHRECKSYYG